MESQPVAVGLLLSEQIIVDRYNHNPSFIGTFTGLSVDEFPTTPQRFSVSSTLTHGTNDVTMELGVYRLATRQRIYAQRATVHFADRTDIVRVSFRVRTISFPEPGFYEFRLFLEGQPIENARIRLRVYRRQVNDD